MIDDIPYHWRYSINSRPNWPIIIIISLVKVDIRVDFRTFAGVDLAVIVQHNDLYTVIRLFLPVAIASAKSCLVNDLRFRAFACLLP